jgi:hypothetical protein
MNSDNGTRFNGKKVVVVTPAGRKAYMEILFKYILRLKPVITEYRLWVNTNNLSDIEYMKEFQNLNSDFVSIEYLPTGVAVNGNTTIHHFFKNCCESNTIYVRFDDDIVCTQGIEEFSSYLQYRIDHPEYFLVYANIVNNAVISHILQRNGVLNLNNGISSYSCMDDIGWKNGDFALNIHNQVIKNNCDLSLYKTNNWILYYFERVSINVVSWLGEELAKFDGKVGWDEEDYISCVKPREINKFNAIYGGFVCVHYAFYTQRPTIDNYPLILQAYKNKSDEII